MPKTTATPKTVGELSNERLLELAAEASVSEETMAKVLAGVELTSLSGRRAQARAITARLLKPAQE